MKKLLIGIIYLFILLPIGNAQVIQHNIPDDGFAHVPLQFGFPYYGRIFTDSYMFSNGVVGFGSVNNHWCCSGYDLANARGYQFNYSILGLQTDLINYGSGRFTSEGTTTYQRYRWQNISEFGRPENLNTFSIEIRPTGYIGINHENINISQWRPVTVGITGNTELGEYTQFYHGQGYSSSQNVAYITQSTGDLCLIDPLSSPSCPNYQQAYLSQQCAISQLYSSACPNYAQAYFNEQCRLNPLYDRTCTGYAEAYALANIVTTPRATVSAPAVQVSTTGTVSIETPIVADPVVNEVIRTPINTPTTTQSVSNNIQSAQNVSNQTQNIEKSNSKSQNKDESKSEKKVESKQIKSVGRDATNNENQSQSIPQPAYEYKAPIILDLAYRQMVKKPIKDNNRAMYSLIMNSQYKHEEMVDEQYRRKGN